MAATTKKVSSSTLRREAKRAAGLVPVRVWLPQAEADKLREYAAQFKEQKGS
jgi:hypothetical protein